MAATEADWTAFPTAYVFVLGTIFVIKLVLYIVAFYCLFAHRLAHLKTYSLLMANYMGWTFCAETMIFLASPVLRCDIAMAYPAGPLQYVPFIGTFAMLLVTLEAYGGTTAGAIQLFLYRLAAIVPHCNRNVCERFCFSTGPKLAMLCLLPPPAVCLYISFTQPDANIFVSQKVNVTRPLFGNDKVFVYTLNGALSLLLAGWGVLLAVLTFACTGMFFYARRILRRSKEIFSAKTVAMNRTFLVALAWQLGIKVVVVLAPATLIIFCMATGWTGIEDFLFIAISSHGAFCIACFFTLNTPYRKVACRLLGIESRKVDDERRISASTPAKAASRQSK